MPGSWGENLLTGTAAGFFGNPYVRDYTHAAKTFLPNSYQNAPKLKFLFHTVFDINTSVLDVGSTNLSVLVKSVKLPSFNISTDQLNQYNRKRITQSKIKYDPVDIAFHDDSGDEISSLWYRYYTYYYLDGTNPQVVLNGKRGANSNPTNVGGGVSASNADYTQQNQYAPSTSGFQNWGYTGQGVPLPGNPQKKTPFFNNVTVFGINRHNWIAYTMVNPVITRFGHDTYDYEQGSGVMTNSMTIDYETVVYNRGNLDGKSPGDIIKGFGDVATYDRRTSPIMTPGANQKILAQGGLIDAVGGSVKDFNNSPQGILNAVRNAGVAYNTFKNAPIGAILGQEVTAAAQSYITQGITNVLGGTANPTRNTNWEIPTFGQTGSQTGAGSPSPSQSETQPLNPDGSPAINNAGTVNPNPALGNYVNKAITTIFGQ